MYKKQTALKKKFLDYSLSKKMNITLFGMVIIPVLLLGIILMLWLYKVNTTELYKQNYQKMEQGIQNLEACFRQVEELPIECSMNDPLMRIGENRALARDYIDVRAWIDGIFEKSPVYENICITVNNKRQLQAGRYVLEDKEDVLNRMGEHKRILWTAGESTEYLIPGQKKEHTDLITCYAKINQYYTLDKSVTKGVISIRLKESELCRMYSQNDAEQFESLFLLKSEGMIISSTKKEMLSSDWSQFSDFMARMSDKSQGIFMNGKYICIYKYSEKINCFLVGQIPFMMFYGNILVIIAMLFAAVIMCLIFCIFFGKIQKHYIIQPVFQIVDAFGDMEKGIFISIPYSERSDEIGILQKSFNTMNTRLDTLINQVYRADFEKKEAELRALTEQVNPHFLYNTLDSIHWKAIRNKDGEVAEQIMALADVYRYLLNKGKEFIRIKDEITFQERYLYLMKMRFGGRVTWEIQIDQNAEDVYIPKLIIQPLIENAIVHGIEPSSLGGKVTLKIQKKKDILIITVGDTGVGFGKNISMKNDEVEDLEGAFALKNIHNRLKIHYPGRYEYVIQSSESGGSCVVIRLQVEGETSDEIDDYR